MASRLSLKDIFVLFKDKASLSRATIFFKSSLHRAILRATTHSRTPPPDRHLSPLLIHSNISRADASSTTTTLISRLRRTGSCIVALKSLIIIHYIIKQGSFSIFPFSEGFNYLKMSSFHDGSTAVTLLLSFWVRWYAIYLETILSTSKTLGYFFCSHSPSVAVEENHQRRVSNSSNADLIKDFDSLVVLMEEICEIPDLRQIQEYRLLKEIMSLLIKDYLLAVHVASSRLMELKHRLNSRSINNLVELTCLLERLHDCKERLSGFYVIRRPSTETLWSLVEELIGEIGMFEGGHRRQ